MARYHIYATIVTFVYHNITFISSTWVGMLLSKLSNYIHGVKYSIWMMHLYAYLCFRLQFCLEICSFALRYSQSFSRSTQNTIRHTDASSKCTLNGSEGHPRDRNLKKMEKRNRYVQRDRGGVHLSETHVFFIFFQFASIFSVFFNFFSVLHFFLPPSSRDLLHWIGSRQQLWTRASPS